jgi:hypothetical protein
MRSSCCARMANGQAAAAATRNMMQSRRLMYGSRSGHSKSVWRVRQPMSALGREMVRPMSQTGQKRRFGDVTVSCALPLKADIYRKGRHVSNVPLADVWSRGHDQPDRYIVRSADAKPDQREEDGDHRHGRRDHNGRRNGLDMNIVLLGNHVRIRANRHRRENDRCL